MNYKLLLIPMIAIAIVGCQDGSEQKEIKTRTVIKQVPVNESSTEVEFDPMCNQRPVGSKVKEYKYVVETEEIKE